MPKFIYKARDSRGGLISNEMEAENEQELSKKLDAEGLFFISATIKSASADGDILAAFKKVKVKEITQFTIELSTLLDSGISLVSAFDIEVDQMKDGLLKDALGQVLSDIKQGKSFSESLAKHPKIFDKVYVGLIKAGEVSGQLDTILLELATFMEKSDENRSKVKSALIYPGVMLAVCVAVTVFLLIVVLPSFAGIFGSSGVALPLPTRVLLGMSDFLQNKWYILLGGLGGGFGLFKMWIGTKDGKYIWDGLLFNMPIAGPLITKSIIVRFTSTFGSLVKSSVPMLQALEILKEGSENARIEELADKIKTSVSEGDRISSVVSECPYFPIMVARMIGVGEDTGALDTMMLKVSSYYEKELDAEIKGLTAVIEPLIIVIMGVMIGAIVLAVMLPMFDMIKLAG